MYEWEKRRQEAVEVLAEDHKDALLSALDHVKNVLNLADKRGDVDVDTVLEDLYDLGCVHGAEREYAFPS